MRSILCLFLVIFSGGCVSRVAQERADRIEALVRRKYDLSAMQVFLRKVVAEHPAWEGIRLNTDFGQNWRFEPLDPPARMRTGAWVLYDQKQEGDEFELYFQTEQDELVEIQARRLARDRFELIRLKLDRIVKLASRIERQGVGPFMVRSVATVDETNHKRPGPLARVVDDHFASQGEMEQTWTSLR